RRSSRRPRADGARSPRGAADQAARAAAALRQRARRRPADQHHAGGVQDVVRRSRRGLAAAAARRAHARDPAEPRLQRARDRQSEGRRRDMNNAKQNNAEQLLKDARAWWSTALIDIRPGEINVAGYPIQDLIGELSFPEMIWLMLRGELPGAEQGALLEAALVAAVDHGPQAPSIA